MSKVRGDNWIFYAFRGGFWLPYACARSGNINISTDFLETTGPSDGNYATFLPAGHSFNAQIDGIMALDVANNLTAADLLLIQLNREKILCRFTQTAENGDVFTKEAYFYIENYTDTGSFDGVATFSISLKGTGLLTVTFTPVTPIAGQVYRYPAPGSTAPLTPGATSVTVPGLGNKYMLGIFIDGQANNDIITSGTPVNQEVLYETSGSDGVFTWPYPFEPGTSWYCNYQDL